MQSISKNITPVRECEFGKRSKAYREGLKFIIDEEDYDKFVKGESFYSNKGYARSGKDKFLHRLIMNAPDGMDVDHINGNPLDNRKCNLRICTHAQNSFNKGKYKNNTSGFKGVNWNNNNKKYQSRIMLNGKSISLGYFEKAEDAYKAYCGACVKYHQEFHHF